MFIVFLRYNFTKLLLHLHRIQDPPIYKMNRVKVFPIWENTNYILTYAIYCSDIYMVLIMKGVNGYDDLFIVLNMHHHLFWKNDV